MATMFNDLVVRLLANTTNFSTGLKKAEQDLKKTEDQANKTKGSFESLGSKINGIGKQLMAGFGFVEVTSQMIKVTAEFQRLEAVLATGLGSESGAKKAFQQIKDFATTSPYEVEGITRAYVRWQTQGLAPSISKMKMLSDVASATGYSIEQTAEAFKDLAVGQTRRIEEIGILATQKNGKIQLSFKGLNMEIEKNVVGVNEALKAYATMPEVLGTSEAIAKTLGGRISNLKDAYTNMLSSWGNATEGLVVSIITSLTKITNALGNVGAELSLFGRGFLGDNLRGASENTLNYTLQYGTFNRPMTVQEQIAQRNGQSVNTEMSFAQYIKEFQKQYADTKDILNDLDIAEAKFKVGLNNVGVELKTSEPLWEQYIKNLKESVKAEEDSEAAMRKSAAAAALEAKKLKDLADEQERLKRLAKIEIKMQKYNEGVMKQVSNVDWNAVLKQLGYKGNESIFDFLGTKSETRTYADILREAGFGPVKPLKDYGKIGQESVADISKQIKEFANAYKKLNDEFAKNHVLAKDLDSAYKTAASGGIRSFLTGLEDVASGQISFGDNVKRALASFLSSFGQQLIELGLASEAFTALLGNIANPVAAAAAIAVGTALVIAAGAMRKDIGRIGKGTLEATNYYDARKVPKTKSNFSMDSISGNTQNIYVSGKLIGSGRDLVAVINSTTLDNAYRKG